MIQNITAAAIPLKRSSLFDDSMYIIQLPCNQSPMERSHSAYHALTNV